MATPTSSNNLNASPDAQPEIARLESTNEPSKAGVPMRKEALPNNINSGLNVGSQVTEPSARPVDSRTIVGSYAGDHRADVSDVCDSTIDSIKNPPSPRQPHTQSPLSAKQSPDAQIPANAGEGQDG